MSDPVPRPARHGMAFPRLAERRLTATPDILRYRLIQGSPGTIEMQIVARTPLGETQRPCLTRVRHEALGHPFEVRFTEPETLPAAPNGKFEVFISEVP